MTEITITKNLPEDYWRAYVNKHPEGNIFHTPEMFHVFERAKKHQPELWAATSHGEILAMFLPVRIVLMNRLLSPLTTRSVSYGSILYSPGPMGEAGLSKLLNTYTREVSRPLLFTELRHITNQQAAQTTLTQAGFRYENNLNYLLDLNRPAEEIFKNMGPRTRKTLRHALNNKEVTVEEITERSQIKTIYNLLKSTYLAARVPLVDFSLFEAAFDILYPLGMIRFTLVRVKGMPASASADLYYKNTIFGWFNGTDRAYAAYRTNEILTWHLIEWGANHGYHIFDFGGAGRPEEEYGVRTFKAKFNGTLVNYGRNVYIHSPLLMNVSKIGYRLTRGIFFGDN
jgi:serine/alanine adding enzyme